MTSNSTRSLALTGAAGLGLSLLSALPAGAHGTAAAGALAGAMHPLLGLDHLLLLGGVGLAAGRYGSQLLLPALGAAVLGSVLGSFGGQLPGAEMLAALAVSALGLALLLGGRWLPVVLSSGVAIHALLHGQASAGASGWWLGALLSSLLVCGSSLWISRRLDQRVSQLAAAALAVLGGVLAIAPL